VARERLVGRALDEGRPDDTPQVIDRRLATYHADTEPVVERYRTTGKLVPLHAERTIAEVFEEIQRALEAVEGR
jgi:adenylate kinase